ncbi:hypothetical protein FNH22_06275 [Fulvivirga sp. M361]|uniref:hypothetical protein n=1 Tax=Fulvivirga sp. M361 TaxID=2594266 RepID=UPI001179FAB0|nr:hypothetical protein [Fulvivirga sp. M361]TRX60647.1 hypothetical protein FNH22_06275 [Fulvivirga sp. M361]
MKNIGTIVALALIITACNTKKSYKMENQNIQPAAITEAKEAVNSAINKVAAYLTGSGINK